MTQATTGGYSFGYGFGEESNNGGNTAGASHFQQLFDDGETQLPPLPPDITSSVGYDMGNAFYGDEVGYSDPGTGAGASGSVYPYSGFDETGVYVHSPPLSTMPPVSDNVAAGTEGFDLGSTSYFF